MLEKLLKNRHIKRIIIWLQQTMLFRGTVSLYDIILNIVRSNEKHEIDQRASAASSVIDVRAAAALLLEE